MADQARITDLLSQLNDALGNITPYKLAVVDPALLQPIDKNAHYMPKRVYDTLVANVMRDGNLSSLPFCWRQADGTYVVLSGNHRAEAAKTAGLPSILILYTDAALTQQEKRAIQLSHNALVGMDNPQVLKELYEEIGDLSWKTYSGLDDTLLETLEPVAFTRLNEAQLRLEEVVLLFLPPEHERMAELLKRLGTKAKPRYAGRLEDFDRFFETLLTFKDVAGIANSGTALLAMCDIMEAWMAEHDTKEADDGAGQLQS